MTFQCGMSVVQVLGVRVDIGVVIYEPMTRVLFKEKGSRVNPKD